MPGDMWLDRSPGMSGDSSSERFNAINQVARTVLGSRGKTGLNVTGSQTNYAIINIKNETGEQVPSGGVLGLGDFNISPGSNLSSFKEGPSIIGELPTEADHTGRFAIAIEPIGVEKIGKAAVAGAVICKIDMQSEDDQFADVFDEDVTKLKSGSSGLARIISVESGTGEKWALIAFGGGGDCDCPDHIYVVAFTNAATSGGFELVVHVNGTDYTIAALYNWLSSDLQSAIAAVGEFASDPTNYQVEVTGGGVVSGSGWPRNGLRVEFTVPAGTVLYFYRSATAPTLSPSSAFVHVIKGI